MPSDMVLLEDVLNSRERDVGPHCDADCMVDGLLAAWIHFHAWGVELEEEAG